MFIERAHAAGIIGNSSFGFSNFSTLINPSKYMNTDPATLFSQIIELVLVVAAVIAFVYLIIAGIKYITAGGDADAATKARQSIVNALIGIVVILLSYFLISFATQLF